MDGNVSQQENIEDLLQMGEDMKVHIAQLKAELANTDATSRKNNMLTTQRESSSLKPETLLLDSSNTGNKEMFFAEVAYQGATFNKVERKGSDIETALPIEEKEISVKLLENEEDGKEILPVENLKQVLDSPKGFQNSVAPSTSSSSDSSAGDVKKNSGRTHTLTKDSVMEQTHLRSPSTPRSFTEGTDEPLPVKYLQMSSTSPKLLKKTKDKSFLIGKSVSTPSSARGDKIAEGGLFVRTSSTQSLDDSYKYKYERLESKLLKLQMQCELLAEENIKLKKEERSKAIHKISTLKKSNAELANIAKRLEEKAKSLQEQNVKKSQELSSLHRELQQQKRLQQRQRVRWEAEQSRSQSHSSEEINSLKTQVEDLKRALRQSRRQKYMKNAEDDSSIEVEALRQNQKEMLHLQKLAAASSSKVVIRSLSTPVTARQKILEESNRSLRKQISSLENNIGESETSLASLHEVQEKLRTSMEVNDSLKTDVTKLQSSVSSLKSELEDAKVEASDWSLQLKELKLVHAQLQGEYNTVHDQLAVAIHERDQAVRKCLESDAKLEDMKIVVGKLQRNEEALRTLHGKIEEAHEDKMKNMLTAHEKMSAQLGDDVIALQAKVRFMEASLGEAEEAKQRLEVHLRDAEEEKSRLNEEVTRLTKLYEIEQLQDATPLKHDVSDIHDDDVPSHVEEELDSSLSSSQGMEQLHKFDEPQKSLLAGKKLFIAKYSYDPYQGPNEHPEFELPLVAGERLYVHGEIDEDGFYDGQLMNGRKGLVPSNFIEAVPETHDVSPGRNMSLPTSSEFSLTKSFGLNSSSAPGGEDNGSLAPSVVGMNRTQDVLPFPTGLKVNELPPNKLKIEWIPPVLREDDYTLRFDVIVNGRLATSTGSDECSTTLEKPRDFHQGSSFVSVCCVSGGGCSDPGHCRFVLSDCPPLIIDGLLCEHLTPDSVRLRWQPLDSAYTYKISVGEVKDASIEALSQYQREILVTRPFYRHTIEGLKSGTLYEVAVRSSHRCTTDKVTSRVLRFFTPCLDPPDPPLNVQVEDVGSRVVVSWIPITLNERGVSNGHYIHGYQVCVDNKSIASTISATSDQLELSREELIEHVRVVVGGNSSIPVSVTVRSVAEDKQMSDFSSPFYLSTSFIETLLTEGRKEVDQSGGPSSLHSINGTASRGDVDESGHSAILNTASIKINRAPSPTIEQIHIEQRSHKNSPRRYKKSRARRRKRSSESRMRSKSWCGVDGGRNASRSSQPNLHHRSDYSSSSHGDDHSSMDHHDFRKARSSSTLERNLESCSKQGDSKRLGSIDHVGRSAKDSPASLYVALFDYNPSVMSPNNECYQDELAFVEGQLIKVYGGKDADGFLVGEDQQGRRGFVPSNMVANVEVDDQVMLTELFERGHLSTTSPHSVLAATDDSRESPLLIKVDSDVQGVDGVSPSLEGAGHRGLLYRALYDYDPREASPNIDSEIELTFARGDFINIYGVADEDGFFRGELCGQYGLVPSNFVVRVTTQDSPIKSPDTSISPPLPIKIDATSDPYIASSTTSNASNRSEKTKKRGVLSKGKKFLKKFGTSEKMK